MMPATFSAETSRWWLERRAWALVVVGILLLASGVAHAIVWGVVGGPWEGPVTWRKPILFGISGGLSALSLGWAWSHLPRRRGDDWLSAATAWALFIEVGLIDLQRWRGVASHFNRQTRLDSLLYDVMGALILFVTLVIIDLTIRTFRGRINLAGDMAQALRAGLVFLAISCLLGIWVSAYGDIRMAAGREPEVYGAAGVPKFPHGMAMHAIQWLPLVAWAARRAGLAEGRRRWLVLSATIGTTLLLVYSLVQTFAGRARFDAAPAVAAVFAIGVACFVVPVVVTTVAFVTGGRRSPE